MRTVTFVPRDSFVDHTKQLTIHFSVLRLRASASGLLFTCACSYKSNITHTASGRTDTRIVVWLRIGIEMLVFRVLPSTRIEKLSKTIKIFFIFLCNMSWLLLITNISNFKRRYNNGTVQKRATTTWFAEWNKEVRPETKNELLAILNNSFLTVMSIYLTLQT